MEAIKYDVLIIGAGPAGCSCAFQLSGKGLNIALLDKETFPRDKICGDALSADVVNQLFKMDGSLAEKFLSLQEKKPSNGVRFFAPNGTMLDIDFKVSNQANASGYISKRTHFDNFLFQQVLELSDVTVFQGETVKMVVCDDNEATVTTKDRIFNASIIIGADGANSIVNRQLAQNKLNKNHHCAGLRQYFENVEGFHPQNHIELHFYKDILPGYFWIFPLPNNQANVGLGMLSSEVAKQKINLKEKLSEIIETHPNIKIRFKNAKALESIQGFGLPIGSQKKSISGNRFLLLGDAASLIDPFTGEGIGNAIRSGRIAAEHILCVKKANKFDAAFNKKYDIEIYAKMWNELRISRSLQKLLYYPWLFNFLVKKAYKNKSVRTLLTSMLDNVDIKQELLKPSFYFRLLFH